MSNTFLIFDTETTGFSSNRIVQIAAILWSEGRELAVLNTLIQPDGWEIESGAFDVHGISQEDCARWGIPVEAALWFFDSLVERADYVVAHNLRYDEKVMAAEYGRCDKVFVKPGICTMESSRDLVKIPATAAMLRAGRRGWKSPNLTEAHVWATGHGFDGSHDALVDVRACIKVLEKLQLLEIQ